MDEKKNAVNMSKKQDASLKAAKTRGVVADVIGVILSFLVLSPFFLVVINTGKPSNDIIINPIALPTNWRQFGINLSNVIKNVNFNYWASFTSSVIITVISLSLISLFAAMAAWVLCRSKTKLSNFIFMMLVASMVIPFQVVMLPLLSTFRDFGKFLGISMLQSYTGIIFAYIGFGGALSVFILHGFINGITNEI